MLLSHAYIGCGHVRIFAFSLPSCKKFNNIYYTWESVIMYATHTNTHIHTISICTLTIYAGQKFRFTSRWWYFGVFINFGIIIERFNDLLLFNFECTHHSLFTCIGTFECLISKLGFFVIGTFVYRCTREIRLVKNNKKKVYHRNVRLCDLILFGKVSRQVYSLD